jgi:geranylgeranyl diphosphate synthase type I
MTFQEYSKKTKNLISENLKDFLSQKKREELPQVFKEQKIIESLEEFSTRGKFIRGTLFLLTCEMFGVRLNKELLNIATALEFTHSGLLIQDDIIDNDYIRRGGDTIFAKYIDRGKSIFAFHPYHYGISTAIVVSDAAFFFAMELLSSFKNSTLGELLNFFSHEIYFVSVAEGIDSEFGQTPKNPSQDDIYAVYKYKTARYTFSLPFGLAGIAVKGKTSEINKLEKLGEYAGIIFQIVDDELGIFGEGNTIGKPIGSDIRENKKTIIRHLLYEYAKDEDKKTLDKYFGNAKISEEDLKNIKRLIEKYEVSNEIENIKNKLMEKVWKLFEDLNVEKNYKLILKQFLEFNIERRA